MQSITKTVKAKQLRWANERGIPVDKSGYTTGCNDNLFSPLSDDSVAEFDGADGGELGKEGKRGKIQALHSSSALAVNAFEFWRDKDKSVLASAMGIKSGMKTLNFEKRFKTGLTGKAPNLDVVLTLADQSIVAIESKFLEPYAKHASGFKDKYFEGGKGRWSDYGYVACQRLAEDIQSGKRRFTWLHPEQLLKHILGLSHSQETRWNLMYLCYDPGVEGIGHLKEANEFADISRSDGIDFRVLTYQTLFAAIRKKAEASHLEYLQYFEGRYFA